MAQAKQDMGSGSVKKLMLQLMIPAVVAQVVNLLYNIVDRIYIGHIEGIGAAALTGVGLFTPILMLLNAFAMLVGAGGAPRTAIALGQGDRQQAEKIISNSFTVLMLFAVVLTIGFYAGAPALLRLFGASDATLPYALSYSRIYILGSVFVLLVLGMNPFITTQGFAKTSMLTTVIGAVINIILDPILIFGFGLGVQGAAIATVLSQAVGAAWILQFLTGKKTILHLRRAFLRLEKPVILPVMALGISTFVMMSTESLLSISFSSSLARYGGDVAVHPAHSGHLSGRSAGDEFQLRRGQKVPCQGGVPLPAAAVQMLHLSVLAGHDAGTRGRGRHLHLRFRTHFLHHLGHAHLHGRHFCHGLPDRLPAELYGTGAGEGQPAAGLPAQDHPADPAHLYSAASRGRPGVRRISGGAGQRHSGGHHYYHHLLCPVRPHFGKGCGAGVKQGRTGPLQNKNAIATYTKKSCKNQNPEPFLSRFGPEKVPGFVHIFQRAIFATALIF